MILEAIKGDTTYLEINLTRNGEPLVLEEGESLVFSVGNKRVPPVIVKPVIDGVVTLTHEDTKDLFAGTYSFDVRFYNTDKLYVNTPITGIFRLHEVSNYAL